MSEDTYTLYRGNRDLPLAEVAARWPGALESLDTYWPEFATSDSLRFVDVAEGDVERGADVSRRLTRLVATAAIACFDRPDLRPDGRPRLGTVTGEPLVLQGGRAVMWRPIGGPVGGVWGRSIVSLSRKGRTRPPRMYDLEVARTSREQHRKWLELWERSVGDPMVEGSGARWRSFLLAAGIRSLPRAWNLSADLLGMVKRCKCCGATWNSSQVEERLLEGWDPSQSDITAQEARHLAMVANFGYPRRGGSWGALRLVGYQDVDADEHGPAERYELRDCLCGSTLAMPVSPENHTESREVSP